MADIHVEVVPVTQFVQNCMLVHRGPGPAVCVDPGGEIDRVLEAARTLDVSVEAILVTHGHRDHIGGLTELVEATGAPVWFHDWDRWLFDDPGMGRWPAAPIPIPDDATTVDDGDVVTAAGIDFRVLHTPGHTPGHVCFLHDDVLFGGDLLFRGSIGRTDLPRGDLHALVTSVKEKIWPLPDDTVVLPGHGPETTIGFEKKVNPFVGLQVIGDLLS